MNRYITSLIFILTIIFGASAQTEKMRVVFQNGTSQLFDVKDVKEITFENEIDPGAGQCYAGWWEGELKVTVGGAYEYTTAYKLHIESDESGHYLSIFMPEYKLAGTMMGDLTVGNLALSDLTYTQGLGGFFLDYAGSGRTVDFKAEQGGRVTMEGSYPLNAPSNITVALTPDGKLVIDNPFKLGAMPFPLHATFEGIRVGE